MSKEIRLLDHTISMYSLVHVCLFCSQFFDPDFPDGIAYPIRVDSPVSFQFESSYIHGATFICIFILLHRRYRRLGVFFKRLLRRA